VRNMASVSQTAKQASIIRRLLSKLNDQERPSKPLQGEVEQLKHTYDRQRKELETYLMNTMVG